MLSKLIRFIKETIKAERELRQLHKMHYEQGMTWKEANQHLMRQIREKQS